MRGHFARLRSSASVSLASTSFIVSIIATFFTSFVSSRLTAAVWVARDPFRHRVEVIPPPFRLSRPLDIVGFGRTKSEMLLESAEHSMPAIAEHVSVKPAEGVGDWFHCFRELFRQQQEDSGAETEDDCRCFLLARVEVAECTDVDCIKLRFP